MTNLSSISEKHEVILPSGFGLGSRELDTVFPFHFVIGSDTRVIRAGPAIQRLLPDLAGGEKLDSLFRIKHPANLVGYKEICEHSDQLFLLEARSLDKLLLKGQMLHLPHAEAIVFIGAPWLADSSDIGALGLTLNDFAIHDSVPDYLLLLHTLTVSLGDAQALAEQLNVMNRQLEDRIEERTQEVVSANATLTETNLRLLQEITERKEFEEELKRSNADLEQFSYAVSHDMRQPLRMISSYLQLIELKLADQLDGEKRDYFNFAIEGAKRIDQMLVALLEYSRVGRMGEPPTWIDSRALLDEALQFLRPAIAEAQAKVNIAGDWPRILVSRDEILRLIQNLIGNAAKYRIAGRTPEITVTSKASKNEWHLCVADNGAGIIPEQNKRLFKVFQRLQSREAYEGTGIGLALCRKIAEHHKGRIWAESAGEGKGSKFCVVLPVLRGG
ncbi:MAG: hypothetical protein HY936_00940 [Nitrosomonadales bacterium]|nr:hypothetical protein [Nitrosomonadales bacterium]